MFANIRFFLNYSKKNQKKFVFIHKFLYFCDKYSMMKIFYVYSLISHYNGAERIIVDKMNLLAQLYNYDVYLITVDQSYHPINYSLNKSVHTIDLNIRTHSPYNYNNYLKRWVEKIRIARLFKTRFRYLISQEKPDVIVCLSDTLTNWVIGSREKVPLVIESHSIFKETMHWGNGKTSISGRLIRWYTLLNIRHANVVITLTESDAKYWRYLNKDVRVITNVAHLNPLESYSDCKSKHVIFVSRICYQKGIPFLIEIWRKVYQRHPDWHLDVYGEKEQDDYCEALLQCESINIHVHEPISNIFKCYIESSILLLTSVYEPFGLVLVEAMSCGLPVVSFDSDYGPREIISNEVDGFLIPNFDIDLFSERVCQLIEDENRRQEMGCAGIEKSKQFSYERIMPMWKSLFEEMKSKS